jgi:bacterioferritin-associated ferredoxin
MKCRVELIGRDFIEVEYEGNESSPGKLLHVSMVGCMEMLEMMQKMKRHFGTDIRSWPLPDQHDHSSLLLRELILKLRGEWKFPYEEAELCHCRTIPAQVVDQAIVGGAHTPEMVSRQTSASTACGTCRPNVQKIIDYRLGTKAS